MIDPSSIRERFAAVGRGLNERTRRLFAAVEARTVGYGGIAAASQATGIARSTIGCGLKDLDDPASLSGAVRRPGSGRPALTETDATLLEHRGQLLESATKGDPMRPLRRASKSHAKLAAALCAMGHQISKSTIPKLLAALQYCRQVNRKTLESVRNPDRDAQFEHQIPVGWPTKGTCQLRSSRALRSQTRGRSVGQAANLCLVIARPAVLVPTLSGIKLPL
jgi:hypothetical protein